MIDITSSEKVTTSSRIHIALVDEFIQMTQQSMDAQDDAFVRESLNDLLATLRDERAGYLDLLNAASLVKAA